MDILNIDENIDESSNLPEMIRDLNKLEESFENIFDDVIENDDMCSIDKEMFIGFMKENCALYVNLENNIKDIIGDY